MKSLNKETIKFFQYAIWIPLVITLFFEILKIQGSFKYLSWFWVVSPIWVWILGNFQLILGGMLMALFEGDSKKEKN